MRRPTNALAALLCAAVALVGRALADGDLCEPFTVQSRLGTAQFNLAPLASMYRVQDAVDTYERNYTYYFSGALLRAATRSWRSRVCNARCWSCAAVCYDMDPSVMNFPSACNSTEAGAAARARAPFARSDAYGRLVSALAGAQATDPRQPSRCSIHKTAAIGWAARIFATRGARSVRMPPFARWLCGRFATCGACTAQTTTRPRVCLWCTRMATRAPLTWAPT